jgi:hypothetical protein
MSSYEVDAQHANQGTVPGRYLTRQRVRNIVGLVAINVAFRRQSGPVSSADGAVRKIDRNRRSAARKATGVVE